MERQAGLRGGDTVWARGADVQSHGRVAGEAWTISSNNLYINTYLEHLFS
jgi:hypothetical protein